MNKKNVFFMFFLVFSCLFFLANNTYPQDSSISSLENLIKEGLQNNPRIKKAYHQWKAAEHGVYRAQGLPDPNFNYGYFGESIETRVGPQEQKFGVSQKVPFPGKRKVKGKVQSKEAQILKERYEAAKKEIIKDIKIAFYDLYWLDKALEINEEEKEILEQTEKVLGRKYESNLSSQQSVVKLQVELSKSIEKIFLIKQNRKSVVAKINSFLGRSIETPIDTVVQIEIKDLPYNLEEIIEKSRQSRQELVALNLGVEKSKLEKTLAKMEYLPDFTLGYEYIEIGGGTTNSIDDGRDAWMGTISVNIPIWFGKIESGIKEKEQELEAAEEKQIDMENLVVYEAQDLYFKISTYKEILSLYETALVPQAEQAFESSQSGFETGSISFLDWLDTQRTYLQTRLAYYKARVDYQKAVAFLERVVGETIGGNDAK